MGLGMEIELEATMGDLRVVANTLFRDGSFTHHVSLLGFRIHLQQHTPTHIGIHATTDKHRDAIERERERGIERDFLSKEGRPFGRAKVLMGGGFIPLEREKERVKIRTRPK